MTNLKDAFGWYFILITRLGIFVALGGVWGALILFLYRRRTKRGWIAFIFDTYLYQDFFFLFLFGTANVLYGTLVLERASTPTAINIVAIAFAWFASIGTIFRKLSTAYLLVLGVRLLELILYFAVIYLQTGIVDSSGHRAETFGPCLYFSVTTLTTVGYGDWIPIPHARVYAAIEALLGYFYMALFIAALTTLLSRKARSEDWRD